MRRAGRAIQRSACGFTLVELMVTVAIVSVLAAIAIPQYQKTIRLGHRRAAGDILRTIYAGEQVYQTTNRIFLALAETSDWSAIFMDNPNLVSAQILPVTFVVTVTSGPPPTFTATATYTPTGEICTINEAKAFTGTCGT